uniref:Uncharacterized protein n=1 Tax=Anguilla anguilla TaxID=7936 RepID=A0A0E9PDJ0_ANGAN
MKYNFWFHVNQAFLAINQMDWGRMRKIQMLGLTIGLF